MKKCGGDGCGGMSTATMYGAYNIIRIICTAAHSLCILCEHLRIILCHDMLICEITRTTKSRVEKNNNNNKKEHPATYMIMPWPMCVW